MKINETQSEFQKFDETVGKLLSVSRKQLQKKEKKYQRQRARLKKKTAG
jgi:hypothetical protein